MRPDAVRWAVPPLGTSVVAAAVRYRDGVAALVAGLPHADRLLADAVACDPAFFLAHVGVGVSRFLTGDGVYLTPTVVPVGRGARHHGEIVRAWLTDDRRHGADLRREHLLEFPGDLLIVWLPALTADADGQM